MQELEKNGELEKLTAMAWTRVLFSSLKLAGPTEQWWVVLDPVGSQ